MWNRKVSGRRIGCFLVVVLILGYFLSFLVAPPATFARSFEEKAVADFYRGRNVRIVVGFPPGGGYDVIARVVARHIGKHIPGNPIVIVENRPGAGSLVTANVVYRTLPQDGTHIGMFAPGLIFQQLLGREGLEFDGRRYYWLGSTTSGRNSCGVHVDTGITHVRQIMGPEGRIVAMGGEAPGAGITDQTAAFRAALGLRFRIIYGYTGSARVSSAVLAREVDGMCITWEAFTSTHRDQFFEPKRILNMLVISGSSVPDHPWLKNAEPADAIAPNQEARSLLRAVDAPGQMAQPLTVGPGVPSDRVAALRHAFDRAVTDPAFMRDFEKIGRPLVPKKGEEVSEIVNELLSARPETVVAIKEALKRREEP
jgi:tripartite-type tricarboxylate transporter receptor subunit TctC